MVNSNNFGRPGAVKVMAMGQIKREYFPQLPWTGQIVPFGKSPLPGYNVDEGISGFGPLYAQLRYNKGSSYKNKSETNRHSEYQF